MKQKEHGLLLIIDCKRIKELSCHLAQDVFGLVFYGLFF